MNFHCIGSFFAAIRAPESEYDIPSAKRLFSRNDGLLIAV